MIIHQMRGAPAGTAALPKGLWSGKGSKLLSNDLSSNARVMVGCDWLSDWFSNWLSLNRDASGSIGGLPQISHCEKRRTVAAVEQLVS